MHLDGHDTIALTGLAAAALDIERRARRPALNPRAFTSGIIAKRSRDEREAAGCQAGRIRSRRAADSRLIDLDRLVDQFDAIDPIVRAAGSVAGLVQGAGQSAIWGVRSRVSTFQTR